MNETVTGGSGVPEDLPGSQSLTFIMSLRQSGFTLVQTMVVGGIVSGILSPPLPPLDGPRRGPLTLAEIRLAVVSILFHSFHRHQHRHTYLDLPSLTGRLQKSENRIR